MSASTALDSRVLYAGLILLVAAQRLAELRLSRRHARLAFARGGVEHGASTYGRIVLLHVATLVAAPVEVLRLGRPWIPPLGVAMLALLAGAQVLRYWAITTLGARWTTRVIFVPGDDLIAGGPYRWMRHPNYLAVTVELAAIPLVHTAWLTALAASAANALLLRQRLAIENEALRRGRGPATAEESAR